jgi:hypothetical protein
MAELLGNASPTQLLMFLAVPMVGVIIFAGVLFVGLSSRNKKQQVNFNFSPKTASFQENSPAATFQNSNDFQPKQAAAPPAATGPEPAIPAESQLNLDILSQRSATEAEMMNHLSRQPSREARSGLSARLGHQAQLVPAGVNQPAQTPANPPVVRTTDRPAPQPIPQNNPAEPVELLRLLRDPQSGQLIVEIAGRHYTKLAEIADKEIGQYILKLAAHLLAFTNGLIATEAGLKTLQAPKVGLTPMPLAASRPVSPPPAPVTSPPAPTEPGLVSPPPPDVEAAFLASLRATPSTPEPPKPQRRGLFGRSKPAEVETLLPTLNLAEQINEIAQTRLRYSSLAATTRLEITADPGGGILINVNGMYYHGPEDIPHPEVKELIKASIQEWERS